MRHGVTGLILAVVCILFGATLIYNGTPGRDPIQAQTIAGAAVLSLGAVTSRMILKEWLKWKKELRKYKEE